jgi:hypothetical protein
MRRSLAVLLSGVLTVSVLVGLHPTAAVAGPTAAKPGKVVNTWFTGILDIGETKTASWKNVLPDQAYHVSVSPVGASVSQVCRLRVDRVWNQQRPEGNKDFWYTIRNVGFLPCAGNVMVYRVPAEKVRSTGGLAPGETKTFTETSIDDTKIYQLGLLPSGATSGDPCKLRVVHQWYTHRSEGDVATVFDVTYEVKNDGDIACQGDVLLGSAPIEHSWSIGGLAPWWGDSQHWNDASPTTAYVPGVQPNLGCTLKMGGSDDLQKINRDGSVEREVYIHTYNSSDKSCDGKFTIASI